MLQRLPRDGGEGRASWVFDPNSEGKYSEDERGYGSTLWHCNRALAINSRCDIDQYPPVHILSLKCVFYCSYLSAIEIWTDARRDMIIAWMCTGLSKSRASIKE
jgi:hypothetical protein